MLRDLLAALRVGDDEAVHRERMLALLEEPRCFHRDCFPGHFTGSALVVSTDGRRCLLHHHRFLDRWLQFGGHCEGEEDVFGVALREAEEESGIAGIVAAVEEPLDLDIHQIPENPKRGEPPHEHYDVRWLAVAPDGAAFRASDESYELRWFSPEEALERAGDEGLRRLIQKWAAFAREGGIFGA